MILSLLLSLAFGFSGAKKCQYSFDASQTQVFGTGYKFTEKKGVQASFKKVSWKQVTKSYSLKKLVESVSVDVDLMSIDSGNAGRDHNLKETLFKTIKNPGAAHVDVVSFNGNDTLTAMLTLNGNTQSVDFKVETDKEKMTLTGSIDALSFAMNPALKALSKLCKTLHIGKDGVSKTWTDFELKVATVINKDC